MPKNVKVGVRVVVTATPSPSKEAVVTATPDRLAQALADAVNELFAMFDGGGHLTGFLHSKAEVEDIMEQQCAHCGKPWDPMVDMGDLGTICCLDCGKEDSDG